MEPGVCYGRLDLAAEGVEAAAQRLAGLPPRGCRYGPAPGSLPRGWLAACTPNPASIPALPRWISVPWEGRAWDAIGRPELDAWAADVAGYVPREVNRPASSRPGPWPGWPRCPGGGGGGHPRRRHPGLARPVAGLAAGSLVPPGFAYGSVGPRWRSGWEKRR